MGRSAESIFNMEYLDFYLVVVWLTKCVTSAYVSSAKLLIYGMC